LKFINTILYIEFQELVDAGVGESTLKLASHRNSASWTFIDDPEDRRRVLIEYESMKPQYKEMVGRKLCGGLSPYSFMATRIIDRQLIAKIFDAEFIERQELKSSTRERAIEACRYLHLLERCRLASQKKESFPMWSTDEFWNYLTAHIKGNPILREKNGVNLPHVKPRLNHLAKLYIQHGPGIVINRRSGNKNSSKLGKCLTPDGSSRQHTEYSEEVYQKQMAVLLHLREHPNNLDFVQITDHYNLVAGESNWPSFSVMQVMNILKEGTADLLTTAGRRGKKEFQNKISLQVKRRPPSEPLRYVTVDGWDVELAYQEVGTDKKGKRHSRYDNRLVVVIILDPFHKYPVGYAVDSSESADLIKRAFKEGIDHVYEMTGEYIAPYQVQSDHYAIKEMGLFYSSVARMHTPAAVGNAKAKVIEPYFKYLNKKYCQLLYNWTGFGITSRRENQPNMDAKNQIKHSFPTREGVIQQIAEIIARERQAKGAEYFAALAKAPKRLMDRRDYLRALCTPNKKTIKASGKGLMMTIEGADYSYDTLNIEFRKHLQRNWTVTYDPSNMNTILVEDLDGKVSFILEEKYIQPMAIADQTPEDRVKLKQLNQANEDLEMRVISTNIERNHLLEEHLSSSESLQQFRQKLMFTNNGQQKDPLQEAKGKMLPEERDRKAIQKSIEAKKKEQELQDQIDQEAYEAEFLAKQEKRWEENVDFSKF
jgi:hypothetical protein